MGRCGFATVALCGGGDALFAAAESSIGLLIRSSRGEGYYIFWQEGDCVPFLPLPRYGGVGECLTKESGNLLGETLPP